MRNETFFGGLIAIAAGIFILIALIYVIPSLPYLFSINGWIIQLIVVIVAILGGFLALQNKRFSGWLPLGAGIFYIGLSLIYNYNLLPVFRPFSFFLIIIDMEPPLWIFGIPIEAILLLVGALIILFSKTGNSN